MMYVQGYKESSTQTEWKSKRLLMVVCACGEIAHMDDNDIDDDGVHNNNNNNYTE